MLLRIYLLFSAISNALLGVHLVRRGRRRLMWMRLNHEEYEFWRERNLFYQAEIGFHDLMDWIDMTFSKRREARRNVLKKALKELRIRVKTWMMNTRKRHDDEHLQKSDAPDFIGDQCFDRLTLIGPSEAALIIMGIFFVIFEIASHLEDPSGFVRFITGASITFALVAISLRVSSKRITDEFSKNADISADIIGRDILEEDTKPELVMECSGMVQEAKVSAVDVELNAIKDTRSRKKNRKRRR